MKEQDKTKELIVAEYLAGDASYREMESRYGVSSSTLQRWVKATGIEAAKRARGAKKPAGGGGSKAGEAAMGALVPVAGENLASEVKRLREELRTSRLHNKLLNAMIDIAEEQFEIPIRKKRGARR